MNEVILYRNFKVVKSIVKGRRKIFLIIGLDDQVL